MPISQKRRDRKERQQPAVLISPELQANILWQCNLGEKEVGLPEDPEIGEAEVQGLVQDREDSVETESPAIKF